MYKWEDIKSFVNDCHRCPLCETRIKPVMGKGNLEAKIMFVAEGPGAKEDEAGIPFVGPAGQMFDRLLSECGLSREDIYITNIVKCHPPMNREPSEFEKERCFDYLKYEMYLIHPKIVVALGRVAAQRIIKPDFRITREHGTWTYRNGYALTAVYHPSALLRDPGKIEPTQDDFRIIVEKLKETK